MEDTAELTLESPEIQEMPKMSPVLAVVRVLALPRPTFERVAEEQADPVEPACEQAEARDQLGRR